VRCGRAALASALALALALAACQREDAPAHLARARAALFEQHPEVALAEYRAALDLLDRDPSVQAGVYRARALRGAADTYFFQLRDYQRAHDVYLELLKLCPEAPETLEGRIHLASLLRHQFRDLRGAIAELTAALARNPPQSAELSYQVAAMYFELQDYEQSELEASAVARKFEASAFVDDALFLRAQALSMMDDRRADAARAFQEVITRFPDSPLRPHALFELGRLRASLGDFEGAIEYWVQALQAHPDPAMVQANISRVRKRLRATTPRRVGDAMTAFDWDSHPEYEAPTPAARPAPRTSVEAVGGTPEEAEREAKMPAEPVPAAPPAKPMPHGEGSL
jgi:tetratricopeptide (TPR) repeat protein